MLLNRQRRHASRVCTLPQQHHQQTERKLLIGFKSVFLICLSALLFGCSVEERPQDITLGAPTSSAESVLKAANSGQPAPADQRTAQPALPKAPESPSKPRTDSTVPTPLKAPQYSVVNVVRTKPGCKGSACPKITLKPLSFNGYDRFNAFLETSLVNMAQVDSNQAKTFSNLADLSTDFWRTAESRYEIVLGASVKRATPEIVVIALESYLFSGGAHGMSTMQYINWLPELDRILTLEAMLLPGRLSAFEVALKRAHAKWLETNEFAKADSVAYEKMWPFQFSDNAALLANGIAVTFDPYTLGPYVLGMPTIVIPFSDLKGIVNPALIARLASP